MTVYTAVYDDDLHLYGTPLGAARYGETITQNETMHDAWSTAYGLTLRQNQTFHGGFTLGTIWGALISTGVKLHPADVEAMVYSVALTQAETIHAQPTWAYGVTLTQNMTLHQASTLVLAVLLAQRLKVTDAFSPNTHFGAALADGLKTNAALAKFVGASLSQNLNLHGALSENYVAVTSLSQNMTLHAALSQTMTFNVTMAQNILLTELDLLKMIFDGELAENMSVVSLYVSPDNQYTTFAINTRTNAITEYQNFSFNSFAQIGRKYIAAGSDGLYELDGPTDNGENVISTLRTGMLQLAGTKLAGLKGIYLGMNVTAGDNDFYAKIIAGDGREYVYKFVSQPGLMTTKVNVGKGLRARYFQFELQSTGPDFDLDSIEFVPMMGQRRV